MPLRNLFLVAETLGILLFLSALGYACAQWQTGGNLNIPLYLLLLLFQGLWFYRLYIAGHEAAHRKLFPKHPTLNDLAGGLMLLPLMVPITIFRKIHYFHHGFNRRDPHTSALDTFVVKGKPAWYKSTWCYAVWYLSVFAGGFFLHSLISVFLFLFLPPSLGRRISPAFRNWTIKNQVGAFAQFMAGAGLHVAVFYLLGKQAYLFMLGYPFLAFAWILSLLVYIFHYDTTQGLEVRYHVRSVRPVPIISWILMNFNEHATHHQHPEIPWYELPARRQSLPEAYDQKNQQTRNFFRAIINQLKGPIIVYENSSENNRTA
jgi:fatty acid desaturase